MISDLKHRVTLQMPVRTADGSGGFSAVWQSLADSPDVYAAIIPLSGSEQSRHHQMESEVTHRITIRYREDVTPAMRIVRGEIIYDIKYVTDRGGFGTYLDILAASR